MSVFWTSLAGVFFLELGDKTQLVALSLAARFKPKVVLSAIFTATLAVHLFSVTIGQLLGNLLSENWLALAAGLAFIGFGFWTLRGDSLDEENDSSTRKTASPFMLVATTFFLAELGDKTMIGTVALAAGHPFIPVWLGSSLGMVVADGLAIAIGLMLGKNLPERAVKIGASLIFFAFGIIRAIEGALKLPAYSWILIPAAIGIFAAIFLRKPKTAVVNQEETEEATAKR